MDGASENDAEKRRIAFLGGAFDPPHPGHEMLARRMLDLHLSDLVLWVPSWRPPHKEAGHMAGFADRLAMVKLAIRDIPGCAVSDIEGRKQFDPSYSFKILRALEEENPGARLQLLIGQDSLEQLHTWYRARELAEKYEIWSFPRCRADGGPGRDAVRLPEDFWGAELAAKLRGALLPGDCVEISSTKLRNALAKSGNPGHIINAGVWRYIKQHGLYGVSPGPEA